MADLSPVRDARRARPPQDEARPASSMEELRRRIDRLDEEIVARLVARFRLMEDAARLKGDRGRVYDAARIREVLRHADACADAAGAPAQVREAVVALYRALVRHSIGHEFAVFDRDVEGR